MIHNVLKRKTLPFKKRMYVLELVLQNKKQTMVNENYKYFEFDENEDGNYVLISPWLFYLVNALTLNDNDKVEKLLSEYYEVVNKEYLEDMKWYEKDMLERNATLKDPPTEKWIPTLEDLKNLMG